MLFPYNRKQYIEKRIFFIFLLFAVSAVPTAAQFIDPGVSIGVAGGTTFGQSDDVTNRLPDIKGRAFLRFGIVRRLQAEVGVAALRLSGRDFSSRALYQTLLTPIDLRLIFNPFLLDRFNPYVYVGGGALAWEPKISPNTPSPGAQKSGWSAFIPAGVGLQMRLTDMIVLEVNGGYNYTFTDDLEALRAGRKDTYWSILGGITLISESEDADSDNDGLTNRTERELGTNPKKADTDGDALSDGEEVKVYNTNPLKPDSDSDGLRDNDEIKTHRTDPMKADTDGDGLTDGDEVKNYLTDPMRVDTDEDTLSDADEVLTYNSNPLQPDTDGDGLRDGEEVLQFKTDPLKVDTDGGTVNDSLEIVHQTNPLDPSDDIPKVGKKIVLEGITFKTGSAELTPESAAVLDPSFTTLRDNPEIEVEISGHTDNTGRRSTNMKLSRARADAVKAFLVARGIDPGRIRTVGYGPDRPVDTNKTNEGRAKNRRIEFVRLK